MIKKTFPVSQILSETKLRSKQVLGVRSVQMFLLKDIHYTGQEEAVTYTVTGSVTDESGKALEGAVVTTGNLTAETDKDGKYSLQLGAGKHELTITKAGYQTATTSVTVTEGNVGSKKP